MENAITKARSAVLQKEYLYALGDDSGIFVRAIDFTPGVHSRRWYASEKDDYSRNKKLLELLDGEEDRLAFLISRFAIADKNGNIIAKESVCNEFQISTAITGEQGFGYDPVLIPSGSTLESALKSKKVQELFNYRTDLNELLQKTTIGSLTQAQKNAINNRGKIAQSIYEKLEAHWQK